MLTDIKTILQECKKKKVATGAFNVINLETLNGVLEASTALKRPLIVQITEKTLNFAGGKTITALVKASVEERNAKVALHLDHGKSFEICKKAIELGFNSVMIDGSQFSFEENKNLTKKVVDYAHKKNIAVQGELGTVPYLGKNFPDEDESIWDEYMTDPKQAKEFVDFTGVDTLAIAIGNAHGFQKERETPDWKRLEEIAKLVNVPLILHGASDWNEVKVKKAIKLGISCFNVDTDIRMAVLGKLSQFFENGCSINDPRKILEQVIRAVQLRVERRLRMFWGI